MTGEPISFKLALAPSADLFDEFDFGELPEALLEFSIDLPSCAAFGH